MSNLAYQVNEEKLHRPAVFEAASDVVEILDYLELKIDTNKVVNDIQDVLLKTTRALYLEAFKNNRYIDYEIIEILLSEVRKFYRGSGRGRRIVKFIRALNHYLQHYATCLPEEVFYEVFFPEIRVKTFNNTEETQIIINSPFKTNKLKEKRVQRLHYLNANLLGHKYSSLKSQSTILSNTK